MQTTPSGNSGGKLAPERVQQKDVFETNQKNIDLAVDDSVNMTYELNDISNQSLESQINKFRDFNKTGLVTSNFVRKSITDIDHWPYTRRFRGAPTLCDATIMDRSAGFRPVHDACYATHGIITGVANLTGTSGFVCGAPLHKSSLGVGGNQASELPTDLSIPLPNMWGLPTAPSLGNWRQRRGIEADPFVENYELQSRKKSAVGLSNRHPQAVYSTFPKFTSADGSNAYAQTRGPSTQPTTCFQGSCGTVYPCSAEFTKAPHLIYS